ncbi:hypothetical protein Bca52824_043233 [Brassica carinata]|uniref:RNA polymerase I-specific transcription initiation factor RRN3 n=1 Tax=Brassica carinata TaxID=52824 RepID=A0A8X7UZJ8_BRACI|nr:hypothetical protein Bca52824_043233 [Brassica carinata]
MILEEVAAPITQKYTKTMGASEALTDPSSLYNVGNNDLSDTETVLNVRNALASVQNGESDLYDQFVETIQINNRSDDALGAQLDALLKALSGSVACIDVNHHRRILSGIFGMSLWDHKPHVMDALVDLIISLAATSGKYLDNCLNMLIRHFVPPPWVIDRLWQNRVIVQKQNVLSRVHEALLKISLLVPLAPSRLFPMLAQQLPKINKKDQVVVIYVENLLKLENSSIGQVGGGMIFMMVMERLRDLDLEIDWDDILQDDSNRGMFDMELEDAMNEGDELPVGSLNQDTSGGKIESLDKLMVACFDHLESCNLHGRLDQVFEKLFDSFENFILNTYKSKVSQFLMFYACSLDPENCGVKFGSKLLDIFLSSNKPRPTRMSAVAYLASYLARGKFLPVSYVATMLKRLVDECADYCRICNDDIRPKHISFSTQDASNISGNFIYWSMVRPTYDKDDDEEEDDAEIIVNGDEESDEEDEGDLDYALNKMSITPKHSFKNKMERERLVKMPSMIRPSTSPESL